MIRDSDRVWRGVARVCCGEQRINAWSEYTRRSLELYDMQG